MWLLGSPEELRPAAPGAPTQAEIDEVVQVQADATPETGEMVRKWGTGPANFPWTNLSFEFYTEFGTAPGIPQSRFMAILQTAMHDAAIAAWDARLALARPGPAATDDRIVPAAGVNPEQASFPSEHAAVAGAAAAVLAYLLPDAEAGRFDALAIEAGESRIAAGAAFRSDIDAGLAIGQAVGELAVARAMDDGSDAEWDPSTRPTGPGTWQPTPPMFVDPPLFPLGGTRKTWVMTSSDQYRPIPPPEHGSPIWQSELEAVQDAAANRTFEMERAAVWWGTSSPVVHYTTWSQQLISRAGLGLPQAAQILADVNVAIDDALIGVWDGKFFYWYSRPITEDPEIVTAVPTPPYPAYPGGYSAVVGAASTVVGHNFPEAAVEMEKRAWEAACSRLWAGIHYPMDNDAGLALGRQVGRLVNARTRGNGAV
jgi:membrane-associated phospholipid phosphatase